MVMVNSLNKYEKYLSALFIQPRKPLMIMYNVHTYNNVLFHISFEVFISTNFREMKNNSFFSSLDYQVQRNNSLFHRNDRQQQK